MGISHRHPFNKRFSEWRKEELLLTRPVAKVSRLPGSVIRTMPMNNYE